MPRRLQTAGNSWLLSHRETTVYGFAVAAFWSYTILTRVLVRALWYQAMPSANMASPAVFAIAHAIFAPALLIAHSAAYHVGLPASRRVASTALHAIIVVFVLLMAKFSFVTISAYNMFKSHEPGVWKAFGEWMADPVSGLGSSIELASLYCVGLALAAGVVNWRRYHLESIARAELLLDAERSRGMALRRQLDPHSLYNTLNAIAGSVRTAPMTAIEMLSSLGELLRLTLRDEATESSVAEEFAIAVKYLDLYRLRYPDRLSVQIELGDQCRDAAIPPLLLQPLVENAALHGVDSGCPVVEIRLHAAEWPAGRLEITISNTFTSGAPLLPPEQSSGIGLRNTWERLVLAYGEDFSLEWIPTADHMATLRLELPRAMPGSSTESIRVEEEDVSVSTPVRRTHPLPLQQTQ